MDSPSPPAAPDPYVTANAQAGANKDAAYTTAALNRPNQYTPYGSLIWEQAAPTRTFNQQRYDEALKAAQTQYGNATAPQVNTTDAETGGSGGVVPGTPVSPFQAPDRNADQFFDMTPSTQWSSRVVLDPRVQSILDAQLATSQGLQGATNSALNRVTDALGQPIDYNSLPTAPTADDQTRRRMEDAVYNRYASRLNPQFSQQENSMRSQLMNRGIVEGSEAWRNELDNFNRAKTDAYSSATQDAVQRGGQEMALQFDLGSRARQNALAEQERKRALVLNELAALRGGQQVSMPEFASGQSGAMVNPAPIGQAMQNQYQGQLGMYNADVASNNGMMGAGMSAAASIAAAFI